MMSYPMRRPDFPLCDNRDLLFRPDTGKEENLFLDLGKLNEQ